MAYLQDKKAIVVKVDALALEHGGHLPKVALSLVDEVVG